MLLTPSKGENLPTAYGGAVTVGYAKAIKENVYIRCTLCGAVYDVSPRRFFCDKCGGILEVVIEPPKHVSFRGKGVWRYHSLLPLNAENPVTLNEGATPLLQVQRLAENIGFKGKAYVKYEGANPTGSFKDRGMTVAVTLAREIGARHAIAASTGNTASSAAAYTARAGIKLTLVLPRGKVALGKLGQSILHGADIVEIEGSFDDALKAVIEASTVSATVYPLNSFNAWRLEGQKTIAFEIWEEIGVPDWVVVPVGNGGNIAAIWKGFKELRDAGLIDSLPKMAGVQASGAAPLALAFEKGLDKPKFIEKPETIATAIRIGKPINWAKAMKAVKESNGVFVKVTDEEILNAQHMLARLEGIGAEPAGAASIAGLKKLVEQGVIDRGETVVAIVTGHALKDPDSMMQAPCKRRVASTVVEAVKMILEEE